MIKIRTPKAATCTVYVMSMFMVSMDTTMLIVALPVIAHEFGVSPSSVSSVNITYLVSLAACLPAAGWIGDRFGSERVLLIAITVFTVAPRPYDWSHPIFCVCQYFRATNVLFQVQNRIGAAIGIAILASALSMFGSGAAGGSDDGLFAYRVAMLTTAGFLLVALALSSRIHDADAQIAMKRSAEQAKAG
ncbi:MFS transporter [Salicibibacter cibi]|uniref:MFS transporter n=1 Tax=Salicibibacter cibi TaxID=2743001 RepID=A0A7T6ZDQ5_9BACI|nr:MFS transporter [Salicibibacter cibi]QQK81516.1 MFS transporter [Salicibibacter cibi]